MDILNFISWIRGGRVVTTVDPAKTLLPVGLKDGRRDDDYLAGAISVTDFAAQVGGLQTVAVDGVTITGDGTPGDPLVAATPAAPYKVYTALLTQSGPNPPAATVLENTIDAALIWAYSGTGQYILALPAFPSGNPFPVGKTFVFIGSGVNASVPLYANNNTIMGVPQNNGIVIRNFNTSFGLTDGFTNVSIEIRVYP